VKAHGDSSFKHDDEYDQYIEQQFNQWWHKDISLESSWKQEKLQGRARRYQQGNVDLLQKYDLPQCNSLKEIAEEMEIDLEELRLLAFSPKQDAATKHHYTRFNLPKKRGGYRIISAPTERLKNAQYWILNNILRNLEPTLHTAAHGFRSKNIQDKICLPHWVLSNFWNSLKAIFYINALNLFKKNPESQWHKFARQAVEEALLKVYGTTENQKHRSIVTNAEPHVGAQVVINMDLKDFFPTISYKRVRGLFKSFGYSESASAVFGLLCTVTFVNQRSYLPQGAPTSPMITNLICRRLDRRLAKMAENFGFRYTRYADDLTFSTSSRDENYIREIFKHTKSIVRQEGFIINKNKTRIMRRSNRQEVTGIVVNDKLSIPRKTLKRFRATLYQIEKDGLEGKSWGKSQDILASIQGFANYVCMIDPGKGAKFQEQIQRIKAKYRR
jgi:RNA-directed DNA polymerase